MWNCAANKLLLVEDDPADSGRIRELFEKQCPRDVELTHVRNMQDARSFLAKEAVDVILLDMCLPDASGLDTLRQAHEAAPGTSLVVLAAQEDQSLVAQALQQGAQDFLVKGHINVQALPAILNHAVERKLFEDASGAEQKREAFQIAALEATANAVIITDHIGAVVWVNSAFERLTGYAASEIVGRSTRVLNSGQNPNETYEDMWKTIQKGGTWRGEIINRRKNGSLYFEEMTVTPVKNEKQEITHYIAIKLDISERRRVQATLLSLTERLSLATGVAKLGVWEFDLANRSFTWDDRMFEIYELPVVSSLPYEKWSALVHPDDLPALEATIDEVIDQKTERSVEFRIKLANGVLRNIAAVGKVVLDRHGNVCRLFGIAQDISERKEAEAALFAEKERAQVTLNSIGDAVICTDISGKVTFLNRAAENMTGWTWSEAAGRSMDEVLHILDGPLHDGTTNTTQTTTTEPPFVPLPHAGILMRRDGSELPIEDSVAPIHDRLGAVTGAVIVLHDVSEAQAMAKQLAHSAEHDFLTDLPNRQLLNGRIQQAISLASRHSKKVAVMFMDLDGFKHINDSLGHATGDKLLQSVASRLLSCIRGSDTVSRQGGDEFVVLLSEVEHSDDPAISAKRILQSVARAHNIDSHDLHVTASIGVSIYPDDGSDALTLIRNADTAMYQAKENGRHGYQFFKPAMNIRAVERQSIEEELQRAVKKREFTLHYQPTINLRTGKISGAEALVRWMHPTRGQIAPLQFIPVAEDCGLIVPIGNWVLREACVQAREWVDAGLPLGTIAVNVSLMEFRNQDFLEGVFQALSDSRLDPNLLELELTESVLMKHAKSTASILKTLRERGVKIAIDDFGTGYSSLSYLRKFPIDALKIDQSFIRQISNDPCDINIVTAILAMGRSMQLQVIAEGVEKHEELAFLQAHQCDEAQGFYFSRPIPAPQFAALLEAGMAFEKNSDRCVPSVTPS